VANLQPESTVVIVVQRGAQQVDIKVQVGQRPKTQAAGR